MCVGLWERTEAKQASKHDGFRIPHSPVSAPARAPARLSYDDGEEVRWGRVKTGGVTWRFVVRHSHDAGVRDCCCKVLASLYLQRYRTRGTKTNIKFDLHWEADRILYVSRVFFQKHHHPPAESQKKQQPCRNGTQSSPQMADCPVTCASIVFLVLHIGLFLRLTAAPVAGGRRSPTNGTGSPSLSTPLQRVVPFSLFFFSLPTLLQEKRAVTAVKHFAMTCRVHRSGPSPKQNLFRPSVDFCYLIRDCA